MPRRCEKVLLRRLPGKPVDTYASDKEDIPPLGLTKFGSVYFTFLKRLFKLYARSLSSRAYFVVCMQDTFARASTRPKCSR